MEIVFCLFLVTALNLFSYFHKRKEHRDRNSNVPTYFKEVPNKKKKKDKK